MATPPNPNNNVNAEFVERYAQELKRMPRSRVFAPLAEAYRKMGFLEEARRICRFGCEANPDFAGGHVAYAKVLLDLRAAVPSESAKFLQEALTHLEKATKLSPDNLLAHHLLGETLIELRRPKEALKAFKMVLFLDPENERAKQAVKKWEFLTADEYGEDVFAMKPAAEAASAIDDELEDLLTESGPDSNAAKMGSTRSNSRIDLQQRHARALERAVSLADAFTVRNDLDAALKVLEDARRILGPMNEIENRHRLLTKRLAVFTENDQIDDRSDDRRDIGPGEAPSVAMPAAKGLATERKREILETLLRRINDRRP